MTIKEAREKLDFLKVKIKMELIYGNGDKLSQHYSECVDLSKKLLAVGALFEEDRDLLKNLKNFLYEEKINILDLRDFLAARRMKWQGHSLNEDDRYLAAEGEEKNRALFKNDFYISNNLDNIKFAISEPVYILVNLDGDVDDRRKCEDLKNLKAIVCRNDKLKVYDVVPAEKDGEKDKFVNKQDYTEAWIKFVVQRHPELAFRYPYKSSEISKEGREAAIKIVFGNESSSQSEDGGEEKE